MLSKLHIQHLGLVSEAIIDFNPGLTVITGETGSGKSMLLSALRLAFGARADAHQIKKGANAANILLELDLQSLPSALQWCDEQGFGNPSTCSIHRIIQANNRSKITINGKSATLSQLKAFSDFVIQIHGQHQQQSLLKATEQMRLLDAMVPDDRPITEVKEAYHQWHQLIERQKALTKNTSGDSDIALLRYQNEELNNLTIEEGEWEALSERHKKLANVTEHKEACSKALTLLEGDNGDTVLDALRIVHSTVEPLNVSELSSLLDSAQINLDEAINTLKDQLESFDYDPEALHTVETRLSQLYDCARKHHIDPSELYEHAQQLSERLYDLEHKSEALAQIESEIAAALSIYQEKAQLLSTVRQSAANKLSTNVTSHLQALGMPGCVFKVSLSLPQHWAPHPSGIDQVVYCIQTNPEQDLLPLPKVASGGELSRVALAIQAITASHLQTPTLIFDEVDVGIGGQTGLIIGAKLRGLSRNGQVVCVTHLPQVAAFADHHLRIQKHIDKRQSEIFISQLNSDAQIDAIAVMLGGQESDDKARAHAASLVEQATTEF
jgi:DNA repair protein RecN (Recombination protein N)